jgi:hypothetical protein
MSVEAADRIERAIGVVNAIILSSDPVVILAPMFGHGFKPPRTIDRTTSQCVVCAVILCHYPSACFGFPACLMPRASVRTGNAILAF